MELSGLVAGDEYDRLEITGTASLDGTLELLLFDGFSTARGDFFDLLIAQTIVGEFDSLAGTALPGSLSWKIDYLLDPAGMDMLRVSAVPIPNAVLLFASALAGLACFGCRGQGQPEAVRTESSRRLTC